MTTIFLSNRVDKYVLIGGHRLTDDSKGAMVPIEEWMVHPNAQSVGSGTNNCQKYEWSDGLVVWDYAMIVLKSDVRLSDYVQPACLPLPGAMLYENEHVFASGWGNTEAIQNGDNWEPKFPSIEPKTVKLKVLSQATCKADYLQTPYISSYNDTTLACVQGDEDSNNPNRAEGFCQGDSGGNR